MESTSYIADEYDKEFIQLLKSIYKLLIQKYIHFKLIIIQAQINFLKMLISTQDYEQKVGVKNYAKLQIIMNGEKIEIYMQ